MRSEPAAGPAAPVAVCGRDILWFNTMPAPPAGAGRALQARAESRFRPSMLRFFVTRISLIIPTFIGMTLLAFFLIRLVPGDPIETMAGERGIDPARHAALLKEYGLDRPVLVQYGIYIGRVLHGDLGKSMITQEPVVHEFAALFPATIELALLRDCLRTGHRHSCRDDRRGAPQFGVRPRRDGGFPDRLLDADLLVGAAADPALLGPARLDAGVRPHRGQVLHRAGDRLSHDRRAVVGREGSVPIGGVAPDPADDRAGHPTARHHRPNDALGDAGGAGRGLHSHREGQGPVASCASSRCTRFATR